MPLSPKVFLSSKLVTTTLQAEKFIETSDLSTINVDSGSGLLMKVVMKRNRKRDYLAHMNFFIDNVNTDISDMPYYDSDNDVLSSLVEKYRTCIERLVVDSQKNRYTSRSKWNDTIIRKVSIKHIKRFIIDRLDILEDLQSINVCTSKFQR